MTPEGAATFVRAFLAESNRMFTTGDTSQFPSYIVPSCACRGPLEFMHKVRANKQRLTGTAYTIRDIEPDAKLLGTTEPVAVDVSIGRQLLVDTSGKTIDHTNSAPSEHASYYLSYRQDHWLVYDYRCESGCPR